MHHMCMIMLKYVEDLEPKQSHRRATCRRPYTVQFIIAERTGQSACIIINNKQWLIEEMWEKT